jgi:hypothetical protein
MRASRWLFIGIGCLLELAVYWNPPATKCARSIGYIGAIFVLEAIALLGFHLTMRGRLRPEETMRKATSRS